MKLVSVCLKRVLVFFQPVHFYLLLMCVCVCIHDRGVYHSVHVEDNGKLWRIDSLILLWVQGLNSVEKAFTFSTGPSFQLPFQFMEVDYKGLKLKRGIYI